MVEFKIICTSTKYYLLSGSKNIEVANLYCKKEMQSNTKIHLVIAKPRLSSASIQLKSGWP